MAAKKRRAPRKKRTRIDADAGVKDCVRLMVSGKWVSGESHADIAKKHGVSPATVKDWATSASRVIRALHDEDVDELRALSLSQLQTCVSLALSKTKTIIVRGRKRLVTAVPDLKAAVMAIAERNKVLGFNSSRLDVTTRASVAHLSREQHLAELTKLGAEIAAETERIAREVVS